MTTRAYHSRRGGRRGVILILVLGVLGLMAVIGVTFATFTGQSRISSRSFAQSKLQPQGDELMDYALAQLICDTNDVRSAIRGHSLARDMYGNDANRNGYLENRGDGLQLPPGNDANFYVTRVDSAGGDLYNLTTNIPANDPLFYGYNFTRWTIRIAYVGSTPIVTNTACVNQSFEIVGDSGYNPSGSGNRTLQVVMPSSDAMTVATPSSQYAAQTYTPAFFFLKDGGSGHLATNLGAYFRFSLDSRWMHAFNGPGMTRNDTSIVDYDSSGSPITDPNRANKARLANFRFNTYMPGEVGMDEDYDAVDLENWFLAMQSADGQVVIPSFHRPAAVRYDALGISNGADPHFTNDWDNTVNLTTRPTALREKLSRILRPRRADGHDAHTFPDLIPSSADGKITYDVDNDGDGVTDSVWVDLGYPARRNAQGNLFKPLFAFMVIGLNGRIPLNTAGNLAGRGDDSEEAQSTHASHLGNSVSEIDPTYGLQNAFAAGYSQYDDTMVTDPTTGTPVANYIDVRLTQHRNLLGGTRPQVDPSNPDSTGMVNGDRNMVLMGVDAFGNPKNYSMPNSVKDLMDVDTAGSLPATGTVVRFTTPVPGRWGEPDSVPGGAYSPLGIKYQNEVRPGYSISVRDIQAAYASGGVPTPADAADDDFNSFDVFPPAMTGRVGEVGDGDMYDAVGGLLLPVERIRRFLTPIDVNGTGVVARFDTRGGGGVGSGGRSNFFGGDYWGRVEYRGYYRPPGLPGQSDPTPSNAITHPTWSKGDTFPRSRPTAGNLATNNNILHGYESFLFPNTRGTPQRSGGMLAYADLTNNQRDANGNLVLGAPTTLPSYDGSINSGVQFNFSYTNPDGSGPPTGFTISSRSDGLNEADEMNLYNPNTNLDAPFTHADLEWLYRSHDIDGTSLSSRLAQLAPISFTNDLDSLRRRRLYSIDTWETNAFAWTNDNPGRVFDNNSRYSTTINGNVPLPHPNLNNPVLANATLNASMSTLTTVSGNAHYTPALAQRGRKINLNMPLPVSNDPNEAVRQKWISDAYQLMKTVLPPRAVDTPEELFQLGQYLVNLIDFRDPDCTMTHWINPDVYYLPATGTGHPSLALTSAGGAKPVEHYGMEFNPIAINETLAYTYQRKEGAKDTATPTDTGRFFIELVNTTTKPQGGTDGDNGAVVSLSGFNAAAAAGTPYVGACWDMVFTSDELDSRPDPYTGQLQPGATLYGLTPLGRDTVVEKKEKGALTTGPIDVLLNPLPRSNQPPPALTPDNWFGNQPYATVLTYDFPGTGAESASEPQVDTTGGTGTMDPGTVVLADTAPFQSGNSGSLYKLKRTYSPFCNTPSANPTLPGGGVLPKDKGGNAVTSAPTTQIARTPSQGQFYWVCLRRPANPLAPVSPTNPMIVVDSMRFPLIDVGGTVKTAAPDDPSGSNRFDTVTPSGTDLYSYQRLQPYRGGQAVPFEPATAGAIDVRYGYTEQIASPRNLTGLTGATRNPLKGTIIVYGDKSTQKTGDKSPQVSKGIISHSLGLPNHQTIVDPFDATKPSQEFWDFFPFHDRDFTSPYELTLVPGTPPGLFTKQFAEFSPAASNKSALGIAAGGVLTKNATAIVTMPNLAANTAVDARSAAPFSFRGLRGNAPEPHSFPYLVDKFFYTAVGVSGMSDTQNTTVGGYAADGWFRMFEFFEVPSQSSGSIGPVAQGTNFDWARQDVRPGMMNLNLLIDEEAFLALLGRQDMSIPDGQSSPSFKQQVMNPYVVPTADDLVSAGQLAAASAFTGGVWPVTQGMTFNDVAWFYGNNNFQTPQLQSGYPATPMIVNSVNAVGGPGCAFPMNSVGVIEMDPVQSVFNQRMKAAFTQFLWLRHGGSGFLFGFGEGAVGQNATVALPELPPSIPPSGVDPDRSFRTMIPAERPFRSSSYPDVAYTMMRPATLPPSLYTDPPSTDSNVFDSGLRNNALFPGYDRVTWSTTGAGGGSTTAKPVYPPPIPARRLFQPADGYTGSNADVLGDTLVNDIKPKGKKDGNPVHNPVMGGLPPMVLVNGSTVSLNNSGPNLFIPNTDSLPMPTAKPAGYAASDLGLSAPAAGNPNQTQHPYFRGEMMQRVMNLSTVRTHQFAVWITVGFFEVIREGDISMIGSAYPAAAFDVLGAEIGAETAQNVRFRSFFVVDRLKLTGFNPDAVGGYRPAVVYRRTIQ